MYNYTYLWQISLIVFDEAISGYQPADEDDDRRRNNHSGENIQDMQSMKM